PEDVLAEINAVRTDVDLVRALHHRPDFATGLSAEGAGRHPTTPETPGSAVSAARIPRGSGSRLIRSVWAVLGHSSLASGNSAEHRRRQRTSSHRQSPTAWLPDAYGDSGSVSAVVLHVSTNRGGARKSRVGLHTGRRLGFVWRWRLRKLRAREV